MIVLRLPAAGGNLGWKSLKIPFQATSTAGKLARAAPPPPPARAATSAPARAGTQFSKLAFRQIWYEELLGNEHQITYYHQRFPIPVVLNLRTQVTYYKKITTLSYKTLALIP